MTMFYQEQKLRQREPELKNWSCSSLEQPCNPLTLHFLPKQVAFPGLRSLSLSLSPALSLSLPLTLSLSLSLSISFQQS